MKRLLLILISLTVCFMVCAQTADRLYNEGKALYDAQNYTAALPKLKAAAKKGHKKAQYRMGRLYEKGRAVKQDNATGGH